MYQILQLPQSLFFLLLQSINSGQFFGLSLFPHMLKKYEKFRGLLYTFQRSRLVYPSPHINTQSLTTIFADLKYSKRLTKQIFGEPAQFYLVPQQFILCCSPSLRRSSDAEVTKTSWSQTCHHDLPRFVTYREATSQLLESIFRNRGVVWQTCVGPTVDTSNCNPLCDSTSYIL